jgi:hypothetical protein
MSKSDQILEELKAAHKAEPLSDLCLMNSERKRSGGNDN